MNTNKGPSIKILINGESGVGKSSLLQRYTLGSFDENISSTIGVDFRVARLNNPLAGEGEGNDDSAASLLPSVRLEIWDTAGQEKFRTISASYYRNAAAALFVYDVTSRDSFNSLKRWMEDTISYCGPDIVMMLVANKIDLLTTTTNDDDANTKQQNEENSFIAEELAKSQDFAREHQMSYCRCSAKTKEGVAHAFEHVARLACQKQEFKEKYGLLPSSTSSNNNNNEGGSSSSGGVGKRIDLNRTSSNGDDEGYNAGYGCGAC